jgi:lauroyl/myristoyl acyltransferase
VSVSDWQRICTVTTLADAVLPLIRTRADLSRWSASNAHGRQMHEAIDNLEAAIPTTDPAEVYAVIHKALASAIKVIARAETPVGSSVVPAVACSSSIPRSLRQHRCRPAIWSTG